MPKKELQKKVKLSEELLTYANNKGMSEEILKRLVLVTGAFIKIVRETGKCPGVQALFKKETEIGIAADEARRLRAIFGEAVAYIKGTSAKLYRDNKTAKELMPQIIDLYFTMEAPAATRHYKSKGIEVAPAPVIEAAPVYEQTFDCSHFSDEQLEVGLASIQAEITRRREERIHAKRLEILQTLKEMVAAEGEDWENIINLDNIV